MGLTRTDLARQLGFDSSKLVSYEHGRVPFPYGVAAKIASAADLCQRWVATGNWPRKPYLEISEELEQVIPPKMLFSSVYDRLLDAEILDVLKSVADEQQCPMEKLTTEPFTFCQPIGTPPTDAAREALQRLIDNAQQWATFLEG